MKKTILLTTLVITQTILASTLTIYNSNIAYVSETRDLYIKKDTSKIVYDEIPSNIIQDSVDVDFPNSIDLYEQTYDKKDLSLIYKVDTKKDIDTKVKLNYLTSGISFKNDYILNITKDGAKLKAFSSIKNYSGKDFKDVDVSLVAGDINRASNRYPVLYKSVGTSRDNDVKRVATNGYHIYDISYKLDINNDEEKRVKLFDIANLVIENEYVANLNNPLYLYGERSSAVSRHIRFNTSDKIFPKGVVRVYDTSEDKSLFLGEDTIANSTLNTDVDIKVGKDFDTKVVQSVVSREDTKTHLVSEIKYSVQNHSLTPKTITLEIPFDKTRSSVVYSKIEYNLTKANILRFVVNVDASSKKDFTVKFESKR